MHTHKTERGVVFNYNSDFSGEIRIINKDGKEIWIDGQAILEFVAYSYIRPQKLAKIDNNDYMELLSS